MSDMEVGVRHALPVKWDGHPVYWAEWEAMDGLTFGGGVTSHGWDGCRQCHTRALPRSIVGVVADGGPHSLVLFRCMTCGYTTVTEIDGYGIREWVLDETDYGEEGSYENTCDDTHHKSRRLRPKTISI